MRTQCKRIYSALPTQCERICNGRCKAPCDSDASSEFRVQRTEKGEGLSSSQPLNFSSPPPDPVTATAQREVWHHLTAGLATLSPNDHGRPWPNPRRDVIRRLVEEFDGDLCVRAAKEAREIIQSQDRAPNVTGLWEKKLRELAEVRATVRGALEAA